MSNNYPKNLTSFYAVKNNIDPTDPNTWDDEYKKRRQELAGIIPAIEKEIEINEEGIESHPTKDKDI